MKYIKNIKEYNSKENDDELPVVGDYAICNVVFNSEGFSNYINSSIGKIDDVYYESNYPYSVIYDMPKNYKKDKGFKKAIDAFRNNKNEIDLKVRYNEMQYWSKNKKELELLLQANKYNL